MTMPQSPIHSSVVFLGSWPWSPALEALIDWALFWHCGSKQETLPLLPDRALDTPNPYKSAPWVLSFGTGNTGIASPE